MANQFNLLDPLGVVGAARAQINRMAKTAGLPELPDGAAVKKAANNLNPLNKKPKIREMPGYSRNRF